MEYVELITLLSKEIRTITVQQRNYRKYLFCQNTY